MKIYLRKISIQLISTMIILIAAPSCLASSLDDIKSSFYIFMVKLDKDSNVLNVDKLRGASDSEEAELIAKLKKMKWQGKNSTQLLCYYKADFPDGTPVVLCHVFEVIQGGIIQYAPGKFIKYKEAINN